MTSYIKQPTDISHGPDPMDSTPIVTVWFGDEDCDSFPGTVQDAAAVADRYDLTPAGETDGITRWSAR